MVVCPATIKRNWKNEAEKWLVRKFKIGIGDSKIVPLPENGYDFVIVNYEALRKINKEISKVWWDLMIIDEIHVIRNPQTVGYCSIAGGKSKKNGHEYKPIKAKRILGLTGTPVVNRPKELWPLLTMLDPQNWHSGKYWFYHKRYCNCTQTRYGMDINGAASSERLEELQKTLRENILLRRLKKDVLKELPPKIRSVIELDYDDGDTAVLEALEREKAYSDLKDLDDLEVQRELAKAEDESKYEETIKSIEDRNQYLFSEMAEMRKATAIAKLPYALKFIDGLLENVDKVVVGAHHHEVIEAISKRYESITIYGKTPIDDRQGLIDKFQTDPKCRVAVIGIKAGGLGITLTAASTVVVLELPWTPGDLSQFEDRCIVENSLVWCLRNGYINTMALTNIQDIKVGDEVLTHKGNIKKVTGVWNKEHRGLVTSIRYVGWDEPLRCTHDHEIFVKRDGELVWVEAHDVLPTDSMAFPKTKNTKKLETVRIKKEWRMYSDEYYKTIKSETCSMAGCNKKTIARGYCNKHYRKKLKKIKENGEKEKHIQINSRYVRLPDKIIINDEWLYLFGWFAAEGFSSIMPGKSRFLSFSGHEKEIMVLDKIAKTLLTLGVKSTVYRNKKTKGIELRAYSYELAMWFREWFGFGSKNMSLPSEIMNLPPDQAAIFLRGYTDGDGYQRNKQVEWVSASKTLSYQMCLLAIRSGFIPTMRRGSEKSGDHWVGGYTKFSISPNKRLRDQDENYIYRPVREVRTHNDVTKVYDITVEEDHSFTTGFATVHNCHRISQTSTVNVYHLVLRDSIDVKMAHTIIDKQEIIEFTLNVIKDRKPRENKVVTRGLSREKIAKEAEEITEEMARNIHRALRMIARKDIDRAQVLNGVGFNKIDTGIGHALAECNRLTAKQAVLGKRIVKKYKNQLPEDVYITIFN